MQKKDNKKQVRCFLERFLQTVFKRCIDEFAERKIASLSGRTGYDCPKRNKRRYATLPAQLWKAFCT